MISLLDGGSLLNVSFGRFTALSTQIPTLRTLSRSLICSFHRVHCSSKVTKTFPSFDLNVACWHAACPISSLMVLYRSFEVLQSAAACAFSARLFKWHFRFALTHLLTRLSRKEYCRHSSTATESFGFSDKTNFGGNRLKKTAVYRLLVAANIQKCLTPFVADANVITLISVTTVQRISCDFGTIIITEMRASNHQVVSSAQIHYQFTIFIPHPKSMLAPDMLHIVIRIPDFGIEIAHQDYHILFWNFGVLEFVVISQQSCANDAMKSRIVLLVSRVQSSPFALGRHCFYSPFSFLLLSL